MTCTTRQPRGLRLLAVVLLCVAGALPAHAFETPAAQVFAVDIDTGTVLVERAADDPMAPASMSKLMTVYMVFERLAEGGLNLTDTMPVSEKAWRMGGSKMFVRVNTRVSVEDLLRGIIVQSGNDACIVIAEGLAGTEEAFSAEMTRRGREIGLLNTTFRNASGWPDPEHLTTARDLATLAIRLIEDFPQYYGFFAEKSFTYNGIKQGNRNPLLYKEVGSDGLKTGHTKESGYGLTASAVRNGRRVVVVLSGLESVNQRSREAERLLDWGFREFGNYTLFEAANTVDTADVWLGTEAQVPLVLKDPLTVTLSRKARRAMTVKVAYDGPVPAPIAKGDRIGELIVDAPGAPGIGVPLFAGESVARLGVLGRFQAAVGYLLWGAAGR